MPMLCEAPAGGGLATRLLVLSGPFPAPIHFDSGRYCLDADKGNLGDGDRVNLWDCHQASNQYWF